MTRDLAELTTERLILRPLELSDADQAQRLFPTWNVVKYLNAKVQWPFPGDGVLCFYRDVSLPAIERGDEWHWTLRLKSVPDELIGAISLHRGDQINRGFWLGQEWQGKGLMTEAVCATNDFWFDVLGFEVLRAPKAVENIASRRISETTGMRIVSTFEADYVCGRLLSEMWEITAAEWHARRETLPYRERPAPSAQFAVRPLAANDQEERQVTELLFSVYVDEGFTDSAAATNSFPVEQVRKRGDVFVAVADGNVLGMAVLARPDCEFRQIATSEEAELHLLSVKASSRGRGIGAALVRTCEERARTLGFGTLVLSTQPTMLAAQCLYQRMGYQRNQGRDWQKSHGKSYLVFEKKL